MGHTTLHMPFKHYLPMDTERLLLGRLMKARASASPKNFTPSVWYSEAQP